MSMFILMDADVSCPDILTAKEEFNFLRPTVRYT